MFRNIVLPKYQETSVNPLESNAKRSIPQSGFFKDIEVGAGNKTFKMDERGMWLGASDFSEAPFRIDMNGDFYLYSSNTDGGYIMISADLTQIIVNDGTTDLMLFGRQNGGF
jgi:hypothetical protein